MCLSVCACVCVRVCRRIINCFQCTHACLYALIYPKLGSTLRTIYVCICISIYIYVMCIYILIRAFKNNTIYSALPPPLLLVLFFCRLRIIFKTCTATKSIFHANWVCAANQPPFPPSRPRPRPAAQALSLLLLPSQLTSPSSSLLLALPILLPVIGRCHWRHGKFAAIATSLTKYSIKNALKRKLKSEKATKKKTHEAKQRQAIQALGQ